MRKRARVDNPVGAEARPVLEGTQCPFGSGVEYSALHYPKASLHPPDPVARGAADHRVECIHVHVTGREAWQPDGVPLVLMDPPVRRIAPGWWHRRVDWAAGKYPRAVDG